MDAAIRAGDFKKITSVLVSRDGRLVHEAYFNGADATTLHNTRSCTKTVTGMLVGIAIDKGLLAGVQAPILPFFPDRQPLAEPGSAQGEDHGRGLPDDELAPRVRRLERVLPGQRGADVPDRGLGQVHARSSDQGLPRMDEEARGLPVRPQLQLLHGRRRHARCPPRARGEEVRARFREGDALWTPRNREGRVAALASRRRHDGRRARAHQPRSLETRRALFERRRVEREAARPRGLGQGVHPTPRPDRRRHRVRLPLVAQDLQVRRPDVSARTS